ncbi:MAG: hypothetical protein P8M34_01755 [Saprospiraceae bacterium]|nr:hypothetical protein [Saprospiraceae bacterium]
MRFSAWISLSIGSYTSILEELSDRELFRASREPSYPSAKGQLKISIESLYSSIPLLMAFEILQMLKHFLYINQDK